MQAHQKNSFRAFVFLMLITSFLSNINANFVNAKIAEPANNNYAAATNSLFGLIAYHDSQGGLSIISADGTGQKQLNATGDQPVWANYGYSLAFIDSDSKGLKQIFVTNAKSKTKTIRQITNAPYGVCGTPSWSLDDKKIAYAEAVFNSDELFIRCDLYVTSSEILGKPVFLRHNIGAFTWLTNGSFLFTQYYKSLAKKPKVAIHLGRIESKFQRPYLADVGVISMDTHIMEEAKCTDILAFNFAYDSDHVAYTTRCGDGNTRFFVGSNKTGQIYAIDSEANTSIFLWSGTGSGFAYGSPGNLNFRAGATESFNKSEISRSTLFQSVGFIKNAALTAGLVLPDAVSGDKIMDSDFNANAALQARTTLSNTYDAATGTVNFTSQELEESNKFTQTYASTNGSFDPSNGQYKAGSDSGAILPPYNLYQRFPITDYLDVTSGNYTLTNQAISLPGSGIPLDFRFTYSVRRLYMSSDSMLGVGWTHSFNIKLITQENKNTYPANERPANGQIAFQESNGSRQIFRDNCYGVGANCSQYTTGNSQYTPSAGLQATLEHINSNNTWVITLPDNKTYTFNSNGQLIKIDHVNNTSTGNWHPLTLTYSSPATTCPNAGANASGKLTRVSDGSINYLNFCYDGDGRLVEVHDKRGGSGGIHSIKFTVDGAGHLSKSVDWRGKTWTYSYQSALLPGGAHLISSVTSPASPNPFISITYGWNDQAVCVDVSACPVVKEYTANGTKRIVNITNLQDPHPDYSEVDTDGGKVRYNFNKDINGASLDNSTTVDFLTGHSYFTTYQYDSANFTLKSIWNTSSSVPNGVTNFNFTSYYPSVINNTTYTIQDVYHNISEITEDKRKTKYVYHQLDLPNQPAQSGWGATKYYRLADVTDSVNNVDKIQYRYGYGSLIFPILPTSFSKLECITGTPPIVTIDCGNAPIKTRYFVEYYDSANPALNGKLQSARDPVHPVGSTPISLYYYTYYPTGQLQSKTLNYGQILPTSTDATVLPPAFIAPNKYVTTTYAYDADGRLTDVTDLTTGRVDRTVYDDVTNTVTNIANYKSGQPITATQNVSTSTQYDDAGRLLKFTDALSNTTTFTYDTNGRLQSVVKKNTPSADIVTTYAYPVLTNASGRTQVSITQNVLGQQTKTNLVCYDAIHRVIGYVSNYVPVNVGDIYNCSSDTLPGILPPNTDDTVASVGKNALVSITYAKTIAQGHRPWYVYNYLSKTAATFGYDAFGRLTSTKNEDLLGRGTPVTLIWSNIYDQLGRQVKRIDPLNHVTAQCFDLNNQVVFQIMNPSVDPGCINDGSTAAWTAPPTPPTQIDNTTPTSNQTSNLKSWLVYDANNRLTDTYDSIGRRKKIAYDDLSRQTSVISNYTGAAFNPAIPDLNNSQTMTYDLVNRTQTTIDSVGRTAIVQFDALERKIKVNQNANAGNLTQPDLNIINLFQYDAQGRVIARSDPATNPSPTFNTNGSIVGPVTSVTYDAMGQPLTITNPQSEITQTTYNNLGNVVSVQGPDTPLTQYTYDGLQRVLTRQTPLVTLSSDYLSFKKDGIIAETDGIGVKTRYKYNLFGQPISVIQNFMGGTTNVSSTTAPNDKDVETTYTYNALGQITGLRLPNTPTLTTRSYVYDAANRLTTINQVVDGTTRTWTTIYDMAGRSVKQTPPLNNSTTTTYNSLDQVLSVQRTVSADNASFSYVYSGANQQITMTDGTGQPTTFAYDQLMRLNSQVGGITGQTLSMTYNKGGQRTQINLPGGRSVGYTYFNNGTLQNATLTGGWSSNGQIQYTYYQGHRLKTVQLPNGILQTLTYDADNRLASIDYTAGNGSGATIMHIDYTKLDGNGNRRIVDEYLNSPSSCTVNCNSSKKDTIGFFRPSNKTFYLRNSNTAGSADTTASITVSTSQPYPVVGDWTGSGVDTIGVYDQATGVVALRNSNTTGTPDKQFAFGSAGDIPLAGRWSAIVPHDGFGIYRPSNGILYLINTLANVAPDYVMVIGSPGDQPIVGSWNGENSQGIGVYHPANSIFYLADRVSNGIAQIDRYFQFGEPNSGYKTIAGNWTGGASGAGVGVFNNGYFQLKSQLNTGLPDIAFAFGTATDIPIAGHWNLGAYAPPPIPDILVVPVTAAPVVPPIYLNGGSSGAENIPLQTPQPSTDSVPPPTAQPGQNYVGASSLITPAGSLTGLLHRRMYYNYDNLGRVTDAQYQDNDVNTYNFQYGYDLNSNRIRSNQLFTPTGTMLDATDYVYNEVNQLKNSTDPSGVTTYAYTANGSQTTTSFQATGGSPITRRSATFDSADRLAAMVDYTTGITLNYRYDGRDNLVRKTNVLGAGNTWVNYLVDPSGDLSQILVETPNSGSATSYVPGLGLTGQDLGGAMNYFAKDGLGSVRALTNMSGAQTALTSFAPYGTVLSQSSGWNSHMGYTGELTDETGLVYLRARYYNPGIGQFLRGDPYSGDVANPSSFNKYGYVSGDPINWVDKNGLCRTPSMIFTPPDYQSKECYVLFGGGTIGVGTQNADLELQGQPPVTGVPPWYSNYTSDSTREDIIYPGRSAGGKYGQAKDVKGDYRNGHITIVGYSTGADSALMFAYMLAIDAPAGQRNTDLHLILLGMTFSGNYTAQTKMQGFINGNIEQIPFGTGMWSKMIDELLGAGVKIYIYLDMPYQNIDLSKIPNCKIVNEGNEGNGACVVIRSNRSHNGGGNPGYDSNGVKYSTNLSNTLVDNVKKWVERTR